MAKKKAAVKLLPAVKSLRDLELRAKENPLYEKLAAAAVENLGAEGLAGGAGGTQFERDMRALHANWSSMVGEYGYSEDEAEKMLIEEINFVRDCL